MNRARAFPNDELIKITPTNLVRVDGIGVFRRVVRGDAVFIEFCDNDRMRIKCRGTKFVEVPLDALLSALEIVEEDRNEKQAF